MAHLYLNPFGQIVECLVDEGFEEGNILKDLLVRLFQVLPFEFLGQACDELFLLLEVEPFTKLCILFNVVIDLPRHFLVEVVLTGELFEDLGLLTSLSILGADMLDEAAYTVDVVGKD